MTAPFTEHVFPVGDLFPHILEGDECPCKPKKVSVVSDNPGFEHRLGTVIVHNSWDGREKYERMRKFWPTYEGFGVDA